MIVNHDIDAVNSHHDLPCVHGEIGVVETPIELLLGNRLVGGIVIRSKVLVGEGLGGRDALLGIEDKHFLEEVDS